MLPEPRGNRPCRRLLCRDGAPETPRAGGTIRRKVVASFVNRAARIRFDYAVQTSNSYVFNIALVDRGRRGDLALPLLKPEEFLADAKFQHETSLGIKTNLPPDLAAALQTLGHAIDSTPATR